MKDEAKNSQYGPQVAEPTDDQINETIEELKAKYDIFIPKEDAVKYYKLKKALGWWMLVERGLKEPGAINIDIAKEIKDFAKERYGRVVSLEQAIQDAKKSIIEIIPVEKERLKKEITAILEKYR